MRFILAFFCCVLGLSVFAQTPNQRPKLVVGIVVDQMRYDYLYRYWNKYSDKGFKRLLAQGYNCRNTHYNYAFTQTGPGHATIYSGTTPSVHGIVSNNWYDRAQKRSVYCVEDKSVLSVGNPTAEPAMSPRNLLSTTLGDELKLATNFRSKVIAISLKDRSSILPGGHFSDGSYWFDAKTGNFITSTFYAPSLPNWLTQFNQKGESTKMLDQTWQPLLPLDQYTESMPDNNSYELPFAHETQPVFPHTLKNPKNPNDHQLILYSPFGLQLTKQLAIAAIENEHLGEDEFTDLLAVSFSSTDYVGHQFGPNSIEAEDVYLRLDLELAALLDYLEKRVGKNEFLVFLSADHGAPFNQKFMTDHRFERQLVQEDKLKDTVNQYLANRFKVDKLVESISEQELFLNNELLLKNNLDKKAVENAAIDFMLALPPFMCAYAPLNGDGTNCSGQVKELLANGYHAKRSGDVLFSLVPGYITGNYPKGVTHGVAFEYDTHVPLLFYGWRIQPGSGNQPVVVPDIAVTVADWLRITAPSGASGKPVMGIPVGPIRK